MHVCSGVCAAEYDALYERGSALLAADTTMDPPPQQADGSTGRPDDTRATTHRRHPWRPSPMTVLRGDSAYAPRKVWDVHVLADRVYRVGARFVAVSTALFMAVARGRWGWL
jgi:hypothetical protein